ncbi:hypothetical protein [Endozoicomonas sp. 4G]|uniref:hypothetical protein n=1 Tax=Endozoicomonas sp. 4G TaxID=2872754 RepID=UPI002078689E|nr:hypothetical protein [Endozoicomonas sp. 4G]
MSEPLPHEDQSPASGFQIEQEGTELMTVILGAVQPDDLAEPYVDEGTPGADGLLTAADKLKLDDIENEATADQTAQEIATAIDADETAEATLKTALGLGSAAYTDDDDYATAAQGDLADTAEQPAAITTAAITDGSLATPLNGSIHHVALTEDVDVAWTAPIPSGGNAATTGYYCTVVFNPPGTGEGSGAEDDGPWIAPFPVGWNQVGGLDSISLAPGDDPIVCSLASVGDGVILVSAVAAVEIAA